jgi:hypothetical protein
MQRIENPFDRITEDNESGVRVPIIGEAGVNDVQAEEINDEEIIWF